MKQQLWEHLRTVRERSPLVHNITNYVVMNNTANALLAIGASPIMSHAPEEVEDMVGICGALVINIGTLSAHWIEAMNKAAAQASVLDKPWILDPVGAGATPYRNTALERLLAHRPTVIRGNASEIMALAKHNDTTTKGVDSTAQSDEALTAAQWLNTQFGSVVCISGTRDIIVSGARILRLSNGSEMMTRVTGLGCTATAIIGACCAVIKDTFEATAAAMALLGVCGEISAEQSEGPGSLQMKLLDKLYNLREIEFFERLKIEAGA